MPTQSHIEIDHQLEKLEFALAISNAKGDKKQSEYIESQIKKIGFYYQEPGT